MAAEYSFEELRAKHRGWLQRDWTAAKTEEQEKIEKTTETSRIAEGAKAKPAPLAPKQQSEQTSKAQTVPLKGSIDDAENDENLPPSQAEVEKAKIARKARREERANRTRKIKVMEVREIPGETQTSMSLTDETSKWLANVDSSNKPRLTHEAQDQTEEEWCRTYNDPSYQGSNGRHL